MYHETWPRGLPRQSTGHFHWYNLGVAIYSYIYVLSMHAEKIASQPVCSDYKAVAIAISFGSCFRMGDLTKELIDY